MSRFAPFDSTIMQSVLDQVLGIDDKMGFYI